MPELEPTVDRRPAGLVAASVGSWASAALLIGLSIASLASGHGQFSGAVGVVLFGYGMAVAAAGWGLWRGSLFARGPVLATSLLHVAVAASYLGDTPVAWAIGIVALVTVIGVVLPSTTAALRAPRDQFT